MKMLLLLPAFFWLIFSGVFNALGEYYSKIWSLEPNSRNTVIVAIMYMISALLWLPALLHENRIAVMGTAWLLIAVISTIFIGVFVFQEKLSPMQWGGLVLSLLSVFLISQSE